MLGELILSGVLIMFVRALLVGVVVKDKTYTVEKWITKD